MKSNCRMIALACGVSLLPSVAFAVQPASWVHASEADFEAGEKNNTVVTNLGDIKLASGTQVIGAAPEEVTIFSDVQALDGTLYIAAGPRGTLLRKQGETVEPVLTLDGEQVFALDVFDGKLLAAVSGETSRLAVLDGDELRDLARLPGVRYIWDVLVEGDSIVIATGTDGKVLRITPSKFVMPEEAAPVEPDEPAPAGGPSDEPDTPDATADAEAAPAPPDNPGLTQLLDAAQANVLCLGRDDQGRIYAGTDTDGLIYRLDPREAAGDDAPSYEAFALYDAAEPEIGALLVLGNGTVYAGTADAEQARPGRLAEAVTEAEGRPAVGEAAPTPEEMPEPGEIPSVPPGAEPIGDPDSDGPSEGEPAPTPAPEPPPGTPPAPSPSEGADQPADTPAVGEPQAQAAAQPTPEQFDALRDVIRQRLEAARRSGRLQVGTPGMASRRAGGSPAGAPRARPVAAPTPPKEGNAVYRIDPQGFVSEVFRESVMVLRIAPAPNGGLYIATGNEGQVFRVDPRAEETTTILDLDAEQVTAILPGEPASADNPDGILLATANPAELRLMTSAVADEGTYTSAVMDATQISLWGMLDVLATIPEGTSITVETRSGNVSDPEQAPWSAWSEAHRFEHDPEAGPLTPRTLKVTTPPARFLQYRLTFSGGEAAAANGQSPVVDRVETHYVTPNMRPQITALRANYPDPPAPSPDPAAAEPPPTNLTVEWEVSDPNSDPLSYKLEYQMAGSDRWILIEEDLTEPRYEWQTRRVPDGRYFLRVTADDRRANPGDMARTATRRSEPVTVDNTAPTLDRIETEIRGRRATITGVANDGLSRLRALSYLIDSEEEHQPVLPEDLIFDSTSETWSVTLSRLSPGPHVVTFRVSDTRGNTRFVPVLIDIQ